MIEPTEEGRKLAADLVNAEGTTRVTVMHADPVNFRSGPTHVAFARLATRFLAMEADMAEIDRRLEEYNPISTRICAVAEIAAKYRKPKPDPLVEAVRQSMDAAYDQGTRMSTGNDVSRQKFAEKVATELAKRGIELKECGE